MKTRLLFIFALLFWLPTDFIAQPLSWSSEISVADGATYGKIRPRIAVTSGNIPVVMWGGGITNEPLYAARWNGTGFNTPVIITPPNMDPFMDTWAGADIAASGNNVFVVFKVEPHMTNNIYVVKSSDGGVTWGAPVQVDAGIGPFDDLPSIAVSDAGNPSVMFMVFDSTMTSFSYAVASSVDGGATYLPAITISNLGSSEVCDCCPGAMAIKGNYFVPAWRRNDSNTRDMWLALSNDGGTTYNWGLDIDPTNWIVNSCPSSGPSPFLTSDTVITAFMSGATGRNRIYINTHNYLTLQPGSTNFADSSVITTAIQNYPFLAGSSDTVVLVYQQAIAGNTEAMYSYSYNGAVGLINNSFVLNNSPTGNQKFPHVAYGANTFHFVWVDYVSGDVMYKAGSIPTGIFENENSKTLSAYPNPSNEFIRIDVSMLNGNKATLEVVDINGKLIESVNVTGMKNYVLQKQLPGIYLVKLKGENGFQQMGKVVFY